MLHTELSCGSSLQLPRVPSDTGISLSSHCKLPEPACLKPLPRREGSLQYISGCASEQQNHSPKVLTTVSLRKSGSWGFFRRQIEELAISSFVSWQQRYKAEAVSGCFVSPLLYTHFALQNCFIWDACLGQAAGVSYYIHLLTNEYDIRVTSIFNEYLLPI